MYHKQLKRKTQKTVREFLQQSDEKMTNYK